MGHKVHPVGFRVGIIRGWDAKWYADKHYVNYLQEDLKIRNTIKSMYREAGISYVEIDRQANNVTLTIHTARPGILIGRGGQRVDEMRRLLEKLIDKKIQLNIREVQQPELDAYLVARSVADQMERRVAYRRAMKQTLLRTMQAGAKGMRIRCAGRLDGAEIARKVIMHEGRVPLHTIRADVDYGFTEAHTVMGRIGVKVWIYKGDVLPEIEETEEAPSQTITAPITEVKKVEETTPEVAQETATSLEAVAVETKPQEQPSGQEEKPKTRTGRRTSRTKAATAEVTGEEKPKTTARKTTRPKTTTTDKKAEETTVEKQTRTTTRRASRTSSKTKEVKTEEAIDKPAMTGELEDKQGDSDATT